MSEQEVEQTPEDEPKPEATPENVPVAEVEDAAKAYDKAALEMYGEYALPSKIDPTKIRARTYVPAPSLSELFS